MARETIGKAKKGKFNLFKKKDAQKDETIKLLLENGADIEDEIADVIVEEDLVNKESPKKK